MSTLFIQFARAPVPGRVKTRMVPALGEEGACQLHRELLQWTCRNLLATGCHVELWLDADSQDAAIGACAERGADISRRQVGGDLGDRMYNALQDGLGRYTQVILVGSDCPWLTPQQLQCAADELSQQEVVVQPAQDGGYVLIGARRIGPDVFDGVAWGGADVFSQTGARLRQGGYRWAALQALPDVDRPADLPAWEVLRGGA